MALILVIQNVSSLAPISDYNYQVLIGDGTPARSKVLAQGKIEGHHREHGWPTLVKLLLEACGEDAGSS